MSITKIKKNKDLKNVDIVAILFAGLRDVDGRLVVSSGESRFLEQSTYDTLHQLSKEFPNFFSGFYFRTLAGGSYSKKLEDTLFALGSSGIAEIDGTFRHRVISSEAKEAIKKTLLELYNEETLRTFLPVVKRFEELITKDR